MVALNSGSSACHKILYAWLVFVVYQEMVILVPGSVRGVPGDFVIFDVAVHTLDTSHSSMSLSPFWFWSQFDVDRAIFPSLCCHCLSWRWSRQQQSAYHALFANKAWQLIVKGIFFFIDMHIALGVTLNDCHFHKSFGNFPVIIRSFIGLFICLSVSVPFRIII